MRIGMIGLGKMGANMTERLLKGGHEVVAYDLSADALAQAAGKGAETATHAGGAGGKADAAAGRVGHGPRRGRRPMPPSTSWPDCSPRATSSSTVGNSNYKEAQDIAERLAVSGIGFVDAGTSGGVWGLNEGYCLMVGGTAEAVAVVEPALRTLAPEGGYAHVGPVGAGHFVKMVHNGIEYGLMQAYAEGFEIMEAANEFDLDLHEIASIWRYGSVVRSWLLELAERALRPESGFDAIEEWWRTRAKAAGRRSKPLTAACRHR